MRRIEALDRRWKTEPPVAPLVALLLRAFTDWKPSEDQKPAPLNELVEKFPGGVIRG